MVFHVFGEVNFLGRRFRPVAGQLNQAASRAVTRSSEDAVVVMDWGRAIGRAIVRFVVAPQKFAVRGGDPHDATAQKLDVLPLAIDIRSYDGSISRPISLGHLGRP